jgi:hypothetical protein
MNPPEMRCPRCSSILRPVAGHAGLLECISCRNRFSPQTSTGQVIQDIFSGICKVLLVLAGVAALAGALLFAGCLLEFAT